MEASWITSVRHLAEPGNEISDLIPPGFPTAFNPGPVIATQLFNGVTNLLWPPAAEGLLRAIDKA